MPVFGSEPKNLGGLIQWLVVICFLSVAPFSQSQQAAAIILDNGWASPMHGGTTSMKELGSLLSVFARPSPNLDAAPDIELYRGVTYLMPLAEAKTKLNLTSSIVPKNKVITAGFPKDSLFHHCFDGIFEGVYNKLYLVTDKADQVVAIQLVSESPRRDQAEPVFEAPDWSMFNFINNRRKATTKLWVYHDVYFLKTGTWRQYKATSTINQPTGNETILRIDSVLMDPALSRNGYRTQDWKFLETSRLYLPKPLMELILHYISVTGAR